MHKSVLVPFLVLLSSQALALSKEDVRAIVQAQPKGSYTSQNHGYLCEALGVAAAKERDPEAEVLNGIEYRLNGRVVGELDLVLLHANKVTEVVEVKCMKGFGSAANKADEQLERFSHYIGNCAVDFSLEGDDVPCDAFSGPEITLRKMSYTDARNAGFDYDIGVTRKELLDIIEEANRSLHAER